MTGTAPAGVVRRVVSGLSMLPARRLERVLFWATVVNTIGSGLYLTSSALFFIRYVGMSQTEVGLGLTISGLIGLLAGVPVGRFADLRGPRRVYLVTLSAEAVAMAALVFVHSFGVFVVLCAFVSLASSASSGARGPLVRAVGGDSPTHLRSCLRAGTNLGMAMGGALAAVAISTNTPSAYALLILGNAVTFAVCAIMVARLPHVAPVARPKGKANLLRTVADRPYLCLTGLNAVMMQQYPVLTLALPLWIYLHTSAPHWLVAVIVPLNTIMVVLLQVRMSRGIDSPRAAARLMPRAGLALLLSFALMGLTGLLPTWLVAVLAVLAVVIYTFGEIWYAAGSYELSFALAPAESQGQYQGLFSAGTGLGKVVSQSVTTVLCLDVGLFGWIILGVLIFVAGLGTVPVTDWALRAAAKPPAPSRPIESHR